ncbi:MAG: ParB N-terminal domain-containing protein [Deltaproteobacteria bacterium]|nr:ParB N-terminal domain-containing protein [Deltaproteobacteria bacterium]
MHFKEKNIELASIDSEDKTFCITTRTDINPLAASIQEIELITLPILKEKGTKFIIVSGFRRIAACKLVGIANIKARVLSLELLDPGIGALTVIKIAVAENALQRPLNLIEQARAVHLLGEHFEDNVALARGVSGLGLPENPSIIQKLKNLYGLSSPLQEYLLNNTISLTIALELGALDKSSGLAFANLFDELKTSLNKQREIINLTKEIALLEDSSILEVLRESGLNKIIKSKDIDRTKKTAEIRFYLKQKRFPVITDYENKFKKLIKGLRLGNGVKLVPPKNFEGTTYKITIDFKNHAELEERQSILNRIINEKGIKAMFD